MDPLQLPERASPCPAAVARHGFPSSTCPACALYHKLVTSAQAASPGAQVGPLRPGTTKYLLPEFPGVFPQLPPRVPPDCVTCRK